MRAAWGVVAPPVANASLAVTSLRKLLRQNRQSDTVPAHGMQTRNFCPECTDDLSIRLNDPEPSEHNAGFPKMSWTSTSFQLPPFFLLGFSGAKGPLRQGTTKKGRKNTLPALTVGLNSKLNCVCCYTNHLESVFAQVAPLQAPQRPAPRSPRAATGPGRPKALKASWSSPNPSQVKNIWQTFRKKGFGSSSPVLMMKALFQQRREAPS